MLKELYQELADKLSAISEIRWVDLWHEQIGFLQDEHPFPTPALFLGFSALSMDNYPRRLQNILTQVDVYVFYETFLDTFEGAYNQEDSLFFCELMDKANAALHGQDGIRYKNMERTGYTRLESGGSGILYRISYSCWVADDIAVPETAIEEYVDVNVNQLP